MSVRKTTKALPRSKPPIFIFKQTVAVPSAEAYRMFTHSTAWRDWFCDWADVSARVDGVLHLRWESGHYVAGQFLKLEPGQKIVFTWDGKGEPAPTRVSVTFATRGDKTTVTVSHQGIGTGSKWAQTVHGIQEGWPNGLENLKSVLETGIDLRLARRPRLGIFIGDFNRDLAKQLGVPAHDGIRLEGTAEGSGARAAGLQNDDVIVKFAGKNVSVDSLGSVVRNYKAGDKVPVIFYRGNQKMTTQLELSKFPIIEAPTTAAELAGTMRKVYAELDVEWKKAVKGLTEAEADHKEGKEWSVKELIAHFIAGERDYQSWVANMLRDNETKDSLEFRPNMDERLRAIVARFKTVRGLLDELKGAGAESVDLLANLPDSFLARKHLYRRVALWALEFTTTHFHDEHGAQLQAAIAAAKQN